LKKIKDYTDLINESLKFRRSAGLAIVWKGKVLLVHTTGRSFKKGYGIPKGGVEPNENDLEAAVRETFEETGLRIPLDLINKEPNTFVVTSRKHKYNKVVSYFIVELDSLSQVGLKRSKVPTSQLQVKEVDAARFFNSREAYTVIMKSQIDLLNRLVNKGLLQ
jgi:8-oxo-dGTP pyrophosphatase MutT (NUDIX family)